MEPALLKQGGLVRKLTPLQIKRQAQYQKNRAKSIAQARAWGVENPELKRAQQALYARRNRSKRAAWGAQYKAAKIQAIPGWADTEAIKAIYAKARELTETTDRVWHVDHIVPLRSKIVCGLHVEANLQIIPKKDNLRKGNRHG